MWTKKRTESELNQFAKLYLVDVNKFIQALIGGAQPDQDTFKYILQGSCDHAIVNVLIEFLEKNQFVFDDDVLLLALQKKETNLINAILKKNSARRTKFTRS